MSDAATEAMNQAYRNQEAPSDLAQDALAEVVQTGGLDDDTHEALVDELWDAVPESKRGSYDGSTENGLAIAFTRDDDAVTAHISDRLFNQQPLGVLLKALHDHLRRRGDAIIADVYPRSGTVEPEVMETHHLNIELMPLPVWLDRYIGTENGYDPITATTAPNSP